jgi:hypothetical protein
MDLSSTLENSTQKGTMGVRFPTPSLRDFPFMQPEASASSRKHSKTPAQSIMCTTQIAVQETTLGDVEWEDPCCETFNSKGTAWSPCVPVQVELNDYTRIERTCPRLSKTPKSRQTTHMRPFRRQSIQKTGYVVWSIRIFKKYSKIWSTS